MMELVVWVEFLIKKGHEEAFTQRVLQQAKDSIDKEIDCKQFDVCIDQENPSRVLLYEIYNDDSAFSEHMNSDHFKRFNKEVADWIEHKTVQKFMRLN